MAAPHTARAASVERSAERQAAVEGLGPGRVRRIAGTAAEGLVPATAVESGIPGAGRTRPRVRARTGTAAEGAPAAAVGGTAGAAAVFSGRSSTFETIQRNARFYGKLLR